jgi:hypothetical protein
MVYWTKLLLIQSFVARDCRFSIAVSLADAICELSFAKRHLNFCIDMLCCSETSAPINQSAEHNEAKRSTNDF